MGKPVKNWHVSFLYVASSEGNSRRRDGLSGQECRQGAVLAARQFRWPLNRRIS